jgi:two-component system, OmpR family, response regulator
MHDQAGIMNAIDLDAKGWPPILVIEDDFETAQQISLTLESQGYAVRVAEDVKRVATAIRVQVPVVIVLNCKMQGHDVLPMIKAWREGANGAPVIVVGESSSVDKRVGALAAGGDDYLVKPFSMIELVARIEVLRRRVAETRKSVLQVGPLVMDLIDQTVRRGQRKLKLLPREYQILRYLMQHPDCVVTRNMILTDVWHFKALPKTNTVDVHISKLRRQVDGPDEQALIDTVRTGGYVLRRGRKARRNI